MPLGIFQTLKGIRTQCIRESVETLYVGMVGMFKQKPYNFTTNTLEAYLSAQPSSLSVFMNGSKHVHLGGVHVGWCACIVAWQNGTRYRDGMKVLWCHSHLVCLVFEG